MVPYASYISEQALDAIYVLEGHFKGAETPSRADGKKDPTTTYYGITENGLSQVRSLSRKGVKVPSELLKANVKSLTKDQARDAAGYIAMHNTMTMDDAYGDDAPGYFSQLPLSWRSAILTVQHTGGTNKLKDSLNDPNAKGSLLKAIKTGDREQIATALISKSDGSLMDEPAGSNNRGRINRILAGVKLMYDTDNNTFKDVKSRDEAFNRWKKNPNTVKMVADNLQNIYRGTVAKRNDDYNMRSLAKASKQTIQPQNNAVPVDDENVNEPVGQNPPKQGLLSKLTGGVKKLFTKEEVQPNAQRDTNVDLQQSTGATGRGTNQQSGR